VKLIFGNFIAGRAAIGLLIMRLVFGYGMMMHGLPKIQKPFSWMGDAPVPGILQFLAALSEFGGGIALILGLLTPLASFGMLCTMVVAILMVHLPQGHGFPGNDKGSYELAALYLTIALLTLASGPGKLSLDALIFDRSNTTKN
jgi:putative oxidoreductase